MFSCSDIHVDSIIWNCKLFCLTSVYMHTTEDSRDCTSFRTVPRKAMFLLPLFAPRSCCNTVFSRLPLYVFIFFSLLPNSVWSIHTEPLLDLKASPPFQQVYSVSGLQQVFFNKPRSDGKSQAERCSAAREVAKTGRHLTERKKRSTPRGYREKELILDWRRGFTQIHWDVTTSGYQCVCVRVYMCVWVREYLQVPPLQVQQLWASDVVSDEGVSVLPQTQLFQPDAHLLCAPSFHCTRTHTCAHTHTHAQKCTHRAEQREAQSASRVCKRTATFHKLSHSHFF